jgi:hypothetical protein
LDRSGRPDAGLREAAAFVVTSAHLGSGMLTRRMESLPPLAWLLDLRTLPPTLVCGSDVEIFEDGFFEGCWAGDFSARDFTSARHVFGSGAMRASEGWLIVTPSHTLDAVYLLVQRNGHVVSNSLTFLVAWGELELPFDRGIAARLISVRDGTDCYVRDLFEGHDWSIRRACFDNLEIGPQHQRYVAKPAFTERFTDFGTYATYLLDVLATVAANGADPRRRFPYELASTCSSGYDSTACTALAARLGARRAFTVADARGGGSDSGSATIERLGLDVVEVGRPARPDGLGFPEAEFIATGMSGAEFPFATFGPHLRHMILLTGLGGERLWGVDGPVSRNAHQNDDPAGASLAEFRLRCSFVHLPVGWIGFESQPELRQICLSEDMRPWRTGTSYERPIARRFAEESGIPRGSFGTSKRATAMAFNYGPFWWSAAALAELHELERQHLGAWREWLAYRLDGLVRTCAFTTFFAVRKLCKLIGLEYRLDDLRARLIPSFHRLEWTHPRYGSLAFLWGQAKIRARYPKARCATEDCSSQR